MKLLVLSLLSIPCFAQEIRVDEQTGDTLIQIKVVRRLYRDFRKQNERIKPAETAEYYVKRDEQRAPVSWFQFKALLRRIDELEAENKYLKSLK